MTEGEPERDVVTDLKLLREAVTVVLRRPVVELVRDAVGAPVLVRVNVTIPLGLDEIVSDRTLDVDIEALRFTLNESVVDTSIEALLERDIEAVGEVLREIVRGEVPVSLDVELGDAVIDPDAVTTAVYDGVTLRASDGLHVRVGDVVSVFVDVRGALWLRDRVTVLDTLLSRETVGESDEDGDIG